MEKEIKVRETDGWYRTGSGSDRDKGAIIANRIWFDHPSKGSSNP